MDQTSYLEAFKKECYEEMALTARKNRDYAGSENAFKNFKLIELLTSGRVSTADGILVRMTDKLQRVANLLARPADVKDETVTDTLRDLSVYSKILKIRLDKAKGTQDGFDELFPVLPPREELEEALEGGECQCGECVRRRATGRKSRQKGGKKR